MFYEGSAFRVPKMRGISRLAAEPVSFSRRTQLHGVSKKVRKVIFIKSRSFNKVNCKWENKVTKTVQNLEELREEEKL